jgi:hypothetical protein
MNPEKSSEVVVEAEAGRTHAVAEEAVEAGVIAVSYRPCEMFEGGLGI